MRKLLHSILFLTALNVALAISLFVFGTLAELASATPGWALVYLVVVPILGLIVSAAAIWRLMDFKAPSLIPALILNAPAAILHVMALTSTLRFLFGGVAS